MKIKNIAIFCAGLDHRTGGYEVNSRMLFLALQNIEHIKVDLFKSTGSTATNEHVQRIPFRKFLRNQGKKRFGNDTTVLEERAFTLLTLIFYFNKIRKYDFIYTRNPQTALVLNKVKRFFRYKLIYTNGVRLDPIHTVNIADHVHFNNIEFYSEFIEKQPLKAERGYCSLIPNFQFNHQPTPNKSKTVLKEKYGIKTQNTIACIGSISKFPKRTDYIVNECKKLDDSWTLVLVGNGDQNIIAYAREVLKERFVHLHFHSNDQSINEVYQLADLTVFASLTDAFGNVIIESMKNGIVPLCHTRQLNQWILGSNEYLTDLTKEGALIKYIEEKGLNWIRNQEHYLVDRYQNNFTWDALANKYLALFE
jgi:glycosyltransferase involved in cell wall biosynthesis